MKIILLVFNLGLISFSLFGTTITDVIWHPGESVAEVILDQFPDSWGDWQFFLNGIEYDMEGGAGQIVVRPNAALDAPPTGLLIATDPWVTGLDNVDFPCCGNIQFYIPSEGYTNIFEYNFADFSCNTSSDVICQSTWIRHDGDIYIPSGDTLVISDTNYFQLGNIYIEEDAGLIIRNSKLRIGRGEVPTIHVYIFVDPDAYLLIDSSQVYPEEGLVCIFNKGNTEIIDSPTQIHYLDMSDGANLTMINSRLVFTIGGLLQVTGGSSYVENSTIGALGLQVPENGHFTADGLTSGTYFEDWDVHEYIPDAGYSLIMKDSYILEDDFEGELEHGPYERGWIFFLHPDSHVDISNSEIRKIFIDIEDDKVSFEDLQIGLPSSLQYRDITLTNINMTGQWPFSINNSELTLINSTYLFLQPTGSSTLNIINSHMCEFIPRNYSGTVNFNNGRWSIAGEFIGGEEYHSNFNDFDIKGGLYLDEILRTNLQWKDATVSREYELINVDSIYKSMVLKVNDSIISGENERFKLLFNFDETNYQKPINIDFINDNQVIASDSIDFFTNTPIIFSTLTICESQLPYNYNGRIIPEGTTSGVKDITFTSLTGCDSIVKILLNVIPTSSIDDALTICESDLPYDYNSQTIPEGTVSGELEFTFSSVSGCDSVVKLNLSVISVNTDVALSGTTLSAVADDATYQWLDCNDNYSQIIDANSDGFSPTIDGNYAVQVSQNGCIDTSSCYAVSGISYIENNFDTSLNIYPNPTDGNIKIEFGKTYKNVTLTLQSINGQLILINSYKQVKNIEYIIDENPGLYILDIYSNEGKHAIIKIVKN